jgi:hypothetical protein
VVPSDTPVDAAQSDDAESMDAIGPMDAAGMVDAAAPTDASDGTDAAERDAGGADARAADAGLPNCWSTERDPGRVAAVAALSASGVNEVAARLTRDELRLVYARDAQIREILRTDPAVAFRGTGFPLAGLDVSAQDEVTPSLDPSGLEVFFVGRTSGNYDIYRSSRSDLSSSFVAATRVATVPLMDVDGCAYATPSALYLCRAAMAAGPYDLLFAPISGGIVDTPVVLDELNSGATDEGIAVSEDGLPAFFGSSARETTTSSRPSVRPKEIPSRRSTGWPP